jgi:hypothetical protein
MEYFSNLRSSFKTRGNVRVLCISPILRMNRGVEKVRSSLLCVLRTCMCVGLAVVVTLHCAHTETHAFIPFVNHTQMKKLGNKF